MKFLSEPTEKDEFLFRFDYGPFEPQDKLKPDTLRSARATSDRVVAPSSRPSRPPPTRGPTRGGTADGRRGVGAGEAPRAAFRVRTARPRVRSPGNRLAVGAVPAACLVSRGPTWGGDGGRPTGRSRERGPGRAPLSEGAQVQARALSYSTVTPTVCGGKPPTPLWSGLEEGKPGSGDRAPRWEDEGKSRLRPRQGRPPAPPRRPRLTLGPSPSVGLHRPSPTLPTPLLLSPPLGLEWPDA